MEREPIPEAKELIYRIDIGLNALKASLDMKLPSELLNRVREEEWYSIEKATYDDPGESQRLQCALNFVKAASTVMDISF